MAKTTRNKGPSFSENELVEELSSGGMPYSQSLSSNEQREPEADIVNQLRAPMMENLLDPQERVIVSTAHSVVGVGQKTQPRKSPKTRARTRNVDDDF